MKSCKKIILLVCVIAGIIVPSMAQISVNSPYTCYGFGELNSLALSAGRSMGGVGIAYRNKGIINPLNPASYTNVDTLTFSFEVGASGRMAAFESSGASQYKVNGNFDYVAARFPICKWMGASFGMLPYSAVGYDYSYQNTLVAGSEKNPSEKDLTYKHAYEGSGGVNQVYLGVGARPFKDFSVGVNAFFMFGNIEHYREASLVSMSGVTASQRCILHIQDFRFLFGAQYDIPLNEKNRLCVGAIFEPRTKMKNDSEFRSTDMKEDTITTSHSFEFPMKVGAGLSYKFNDQLTLSVDYTMQQWAKANYYGVRDSLRNTQMFAVGFEYVPNMYGKKLYQRIRYRAGVNFSNSYLKNIHELYLYTATIGFGIPVRRNTSFLTVGLEYGHKGKKGTYVLRENYLKALVSISLVERWFVKRVIR